MGYSNICSSSHPMYLYRTHMVKVGLTSISASFKLQVFPFICKLQEIKEGHNHVLLRHSLSARNEFVIHGDCSIVE